MKSWAVTRGPSLVPGEKRLAVEVEDHPIEYNKFEGTIPKGEYGGGTVMIWDRGTWQPEADPHKGLKKGHLAFVLDGEKLHGGWHLVRMHRRAGEKRNNWLLIKQHDDAERSARDKDILEQKPLVGRERPHHGRDRQGRAEEERRRDKSAEKRSRQRAEAAAGRDPAADQGHYERKKQVAARERSRPARLCRSLASRRSRTRHRTATTGSTKSSSTATASRRGSTTAR